MTAQHFKSFLFTKKIEKFQLHGNNSVCTGAFQLLTSHAPAQLRGNSDVTYNVYCKVYFIIWLNYFQPETLVCIVAKTRKCWESFKKLKKES
jgi:hypothetical protein